MATPITDVVRLLKENRASQRERRAADKDVILALTKIDTDKEIRLLSTQIEYMDRERRDIDKNIASGLEKLDEYNLAIEYRIGEEERLDPIARTTGGVSTAKDIYQMMEMMETDLANSRAYLADIKKKSGDAAIKKTELEGMQAFYQGEGVTDYDKSGIIDKGDVSFESYNALRNITDADMEKYLTKYAERLTPNEAKLIASNNKYPCKSN